MIINTETIKKLNPCKSRFDNYLEHYNDFNGTLEDFILLENISYSDKVWVFVRLATHMQNVTWSLLCATKVLSIFEEKHPEDKRPRQALEAAEAYLNNPTEENKNAAYAAANAAYATDYAAANAAAYAAYAAANAAANAAYAAYAAANAADYATSDARNIEEEVNLLLMIEAIKGE